MNKLSQFLVESIIGEAESVDNIIVVYAGRFQPFHKGHYATYSHLVKKFGKKNVYIGTSNKTDNKKSPFNFKEKVMIMNTMFGVPKNQIVQVKNPYVPTEVLKKFDKDTTAFVTVVGKKDASRLGGKFFTPYKDGIDYEGYEDRGYVYIAPEGGGGVSGTEVRRGLKSGSDEDKKKFFTKRAYPKFNQKIFDFIVDKLSTLPEINLETITIPKEVTLEWLKNGGSKLIENSFIQGSQEVDDGPNYLYPSFNAFDKSSRKRAEQIGWEVVRQIMSDDLVDIDPHPIYPNGPVKAVTPYPAGVIGKVTATNQKDFMSDEAYDKWMKHITKAAETSGFSLISYFIGLDDFPNFDYEEEDLGIDIGGSNFVEEDIKLPVNVGDTILTGRFKNKKTVVKTIGKDEHGMPTINGRKVVNFRILKEGTINEIPMADLVKIDQYADKQLNPVDVVLTDKHFFDRLQDPRNKKDISQAELIGFFKRLGKRKKDFVNFLNQYNQIVAKDNRSKINIPFMKQANKIIAKTVMRKDDFKTSSPEYNFEQLAKGMDIYDIANMHKVDIDDLNVELQKGIEVEKEHTSDKDVAKKIALDHLYEDPKYYTKLATIEEEVNSFFYMDFKKWAYKNRAKINRMDYEDKVDFLSDKYMKDHGKWHRGESPDYIGAELVDLLVKDRIIKEGLGHGYPDQEWIDNHEKELKKLRSKFDSEKKDLNFDKSYAVQEGQIDSGEPETGYLPDGKKRKLGKSSGRPEYWFDQLGFTQTDFPKADKMRGTGKNKDKDSTFRKVTYKTKNVKVSKLQQALKPVGSDEWVNVVQESDISGLSGGNNSARWTAPGQSKNLKVAQLSGYEQKDFPTADELDISGEEFGYESQSKTKKYNNKRKAVRTTDGQLVFENINESKLLLEGGAYGHMNHPFDTEINLTFGQLKDIVNKALEGNLELTREKTDGQALAVSWRDGRLVAARNKGHLKNKGAGALDIKGVATKFAGRGELEKAYNFAMNDLTNAIGSLSEKQREKIFKGGACFMNLEVIYPTSVNVIPYGQPLLVFHGTMEYNDDGIAIGENQEAARILAGMIKQVNADVQSAYTIQGPPVVELPKSKDLTKTKAKYNGQISKLQSKFKLKDNDGIGEYHQAWWMDFVTKKSPSKLDNKTLMGLVKRWAFYDKSFRLDKKNITDEKTLEWAKGIDKNDHAKMAKDNIRPFEDIFLGLGAEVLSFMSSALTVNPDKAVRDMKKRLDQTIKDVRKSGDPKKVKKLKLELERLNSIGGKNKIVPNEGIVFVYGGKTFKLTGTFAPLNQILGLFYE